MIRHDIVQREPSRPEPQTPTLASGQVILFEQYTLWRRTWKWVMLIALVVTAVVAYLFFVVIPVEYAGVVRVVPPNKSGTPLDNIIGGISSTLKDFGLSKLVGKAASGEGYSRSVLLNSQPLFDSLIAHHNLFDVYDIPEGRYDLAYKILGGTVDIAIEDEGPIRITVYDVEPKRAAAMATDVVEIANTIARDRNRLETEYISKYIRGQLQQKQQEQTNLENRIAEFMQKNRMYFDPETQATVLGSAVMQAEMDVALRRQTYEFYKNLYGQEDPRTLQAQELLKQSEATSQRLAAGQAGTIGGPSVPSLPKSAVEFARMKLQYEANAKYLALITPMYEQSQFDEIRNIPVLYVLDPARVPVDKARPKRSVILLSAFLGTILISYLVIALAAYYRNFLWRYRSWMAMRSGVLNASGGQSSAESE